MAEEETKISRASSPSGDDASGRPDQPAEQTDLGKKEEVASKDKVSKAGEEVKGEKKETKEVPAVEEKQKAKAAEGSLPDASSAEEASRVEVPKEFKKLVEDIEKMTVLELNELVKVLEKRFGVSAQAVATAPAAGAAGEGTSEEQDSFSIELKGSGDQKIAVIKIVKEVFGLGLKEAKDMVDGAPTMLKEDVKKEEAEEIKQKIEGAGGKVELK